jgi:alpha-ribazole phosphatase
MADLHLWRHPRPRDVAGRCIGRTDVAVDPRRAKRLAHRVRAAARREGLPRVVHTSPLQRCADVGRWLRRWGWVHRIDARLIELDFGAWDGQRWTQIAHTEVLAWEADFLQHAPGGGESLAALRARVHDFLASAVGTPRLIVAHAGWINTLRTADQPDLQSADWPAALRYGARLSCSVAARIDPGAAL